MQNWMFIWLEEIGQPQVLFMDFTKKKEVSKYMLIKHVIRVIYCSFIKLIKEEQDKDENKVTIKTESINHCIQQFNTPSNLTELWVWHKKELLFV